MVHEQQVVSRWKRELNKTIRDVFSLSNFGVVEVERQDSEVLANDPDGVHFGTVFLVWRHLLVLLVCVRVDFVHVAECDVISAQEVVLLVRDDFLRKKNVI